MVPLLTPTHSWGPQHEAVQTLKPGLLHLSTMGPESIIPSPWSTFTAFTTRTKMPKVFLSCFVTEVLISTDPTPPAFLTIYWRMPLTQVSNTSKNSWTTNGIAAGSAQSLATKLMTLRLPTQKAFKLPRTQQPLNIPVNSHGKLLQEPFPNGFLSLQQFSSKAFSINQLYAISWKKNKRKKQNNFAKYSFPLFPNITTQKGWLLAGVKSVGDK